MNYKDIKDTRPLRIICAAIWCQTGIDAMGHYGKMPRTGIVFGHWRHAGCMAAWRAWLMGMADKDLQARVRSGEIKSVQGFIDNEGAFWDREEAYKIARAAGQMDWLGNGGEGLRKPTLFSEDLY